MSILQIEESTGAAESRLEAGGPDWQLMAESLRLMATAAGGDLLRAGTLTTRFQRFQREVDAYYVIAVAAERRDLDGKPHRVSVDARAPRATLQHTPTFARSITPVTGEQLGQRREAAIRSAGAARAVPLGVQTITVRGEDPKRLQVIAIVRSPHPGIEDARIGLEVRNGPQVVVAQGGRFDAADTVAGVTSHVSTLLAPPGRYELRVAVVDAQGQAGSVRHAFAADLPAAGSVLASGLVLGQTSGGGPLRPSIDLVNDRPTNAVIELYSIGSAGEPPEVTLTVSSVDGGAAGREVAARVERTDVDGIQRAVGSIDMQDLKPGAYLVRASVRSGDRTAVVDQHVVLHATAPVTAAVPTPPEIPAIVRRASAYVEEYLADLSNVLMDEDYQQQQRIAGRLTTRRLLSEMLFVSLPSPVGPTAFRDVFSVDGRRIRNRDDRLRRLFAEQQPSAVEQAQRIVSESARFNLGAAVRTLNVPTVPLLFLRTAYLPRMVWTTAGDQEVSGRRLTRVRFGEQGGRTVLSGPDGRAVKAQGEFWIDPESGTVWRAELSIVMHDGDPRVASPELDGRLGVVFRAHQEWGMLVPEEMTERYVLRNGEENDARADYSDYRRFRVETAEATPQ